MIYTTGAIDKDTPEMEVARRFTNEYPLYHGDTQMWSEVVEFLENAHHASKKEWAYCIGRGGTTDRWLAKLGSEAYARKIFRLAKGMTGQ
jgi:hypothetical protein